MKNFLLLILLVIGLTGYSQPASMLYEQSDKHPYGSLNPEAPPQTGDFADIIGMCDCKSVQRNSDGTWQDTVQMEWKFKYIMNGTAVQDEVWRNNGMMAGSIRLFHPDSAKWVVTYYSSGSFGLTYPTWVGERASENSIVLLMDQKAPNGMDGESRLSFLNMSKEGFEWEGAWVSKDGSTVYPFWMISCVKRL